MQKKYRHKMTGEIMDEDGVDAELEDLYFEYADLARLGSLSDFKDAQVRNLFEEIEEDEPNDRE